MCSAAAVKHNPQTAAASQKDTERCLQKWFGNARDRHGGLRKRLEKKVIARTETGEKTPDSMSTLVGERPSTPPITQKRLSTTMSSQLTKVTHRNVSMPASRATTPVAVVACTETGEITPDNVFAPADERCSMPPFVPRKFLTSKSSQAKNHQSFDL